jgi:hypothetical protein
MKEYIVALKKGVDYDAFWNEIENLSPDDGFVPSRRVDISNNRSGFERICQYFLTDEEAELLRQDSRVSAVDLPIKDNPLLIVKSTTVQDNNFDKPVSSSSTGNIVNYGLIRHNNSTNIYGTSTTTTETYNYVLDGTGVDIVISDSGIQSDHPEFQYVGNSTSRVNQINWADYVPALSTMANAYQDPDGHGTHVAGTAAGKTYGWAKGSEIYSIVATGTNAADPIDLFEAVKLWHQSKTNDRPTVLNMSWLIRYNYLFFGANATSATNNILANVTSVTYQGVTYPGNASVTNYGVLLDSANSLCLSSVVNGIPAIVSSYDIALEECIDAGVVACKSAGNNSYKIDIAGGADYNNYLTYTGLGNVVYHKGSSPTAADMVCVGSLNSTSYSSTQDQRVSYSCAGIGVDVYGCGTLILSATTSNVSAPSYATSAPYFLNNSYRQLNNTGTSMASPQIAGMCALYLQTNPGNIFSANNSANLKSWIVNNSTSTMYSSGNSTSYLDSTSVLGGNAIVAYQDIQGLTQIKDSGNNWVTVANVYVKTDSSTWAQVQNIYTKTDSSTWKQTY